MALASPTPCPASVVSAGAVVAARGFAATAGAGFVVVEPVVAGSVVVVVAVCVPPPDGLKPLK